MRAARWNGQALVEVRIDQPVDAALGDAAQRGERDGGGIERESQRRAVKIAAGDHVAAGKHQRVIGGRAGFRLHRLPREVQCAAHRAVHLRHAPQAVGILHAGGRATARWIDVACVQETPQPRGRYTLPGMRARRMDARVEGRGRAEQGLAGHGACNIGQADQPQGAPQRQSAHGRQRLGSVEQRQTSWPARTGSISARRKARCPACGGPGTRLRLANHAECRVGQRARPLARPILPESGLHAAVEHRGQGLHHQRAPPLNPRTACWRAGQS
jgi:hypothetical protein